MSVNLFICEFFKSLLAAVVKKLAWRLYLIIILQRTRHNSNFIHSITRDKRTANYCNEEYKELIAVRENK